MFVDELEAELIGAGFTPATIAETDRDIRVYLLRDEDNKFRFIYVLNHEMGKRVGGALLENITKNISNDFYRRGANGISSICIILSSDPDVELSYGKNGSQITAYSDTDISFWIVDTSKRRLMIFEDQPEDFYGLRSLIEETLDGNGRAQKKGTPEWEKYNKIRRDSGDKRKVLTIPVITIVLCLINVLLFIIMEIDGSTLDSNYMLGMGASTPEYIIEKHQIYRLFTSMFLHFGFEHLISNMFMLFILGSVVERTVKSLPFLFMYITSGLVGSMISAAQLYNNGESTMVCAGASGAIYGIMGAYIMIMLFSVLRLPPRERRGQLASIIPRIIIVVGLTVSVAFYDKNIDVTAHIAGFVTGIVVARLWLIIFQMGINKRRQE